MSFCFVMKAYVSGFVTEFWILKQLCMSSAISVRVGVLLLRMSRFQSLTIWLNSLATSVGSIIVTMWIPV